MPEPSVRFLLKDHLRIHLRESMVRVRITSGAMNAVVFLEPETAEELGGDLIDMAGKVTD